MGILGSGSLPPAVKKAQEERFKSKHDEYMELVNAANARGLSLAEYKATLIQEANDKEAELSQAAKDERMNDRLGRLRNGGVAVSLARLEAAAARAKSEPENG